MAIIVIVGKILCTA